jgi:phage gp36-like protein
MHTTLHYIVTDNNRCTTPCPTYPTIMVASHLCAMCKYFIKDNKDKKELTCSYKEGTNE